MILVSISVIGSRPGENWLDKLRENLLRGRPDADIIEPTSPVNIERLDNSIIIQVSYGSLNPLYPDQFSSFSAAISTLVVSSLFLTSPVPMHIRLESSSLDQEIFKIVSTDPERETTVRVSDIR